MKPGFLFSLEKKQNNCLVSVSLATKNEHAIYSSK
jgi:hypothetical protein